MAAGRSVLTVMVKVGGTSLRFGTVHLESPVPGTPAAAARKEQLYQVWIDPQAMALILQVLLRGSLSKVPSIAAVGTEGSHNT